MAPLTDDELNHLLSLWVAPAAPYSLEQKLFERRLPWWKRLFGKIRRGTPRTNRQRLRRSKRRV